MPLKEDKGGLRGRQLTVVRPPEPTRQLADVLPSARPAGAHSCRRDRQVKTRRVKRGRCRRSGVRQDLFHTLGEVCVAPFSQPPPQVIGFEPEHVADVLKRETRRVFLLGNGTRLWNHEPIPRLTEHPLPVRVPGDEIFLKTKDRVFKNGNNEQPLPFLPRRLPPQGGEKLGGEHSVWLE